MAQWRPRVVRAVMGVTIAGAAACRSAGPAASARAPCTSPTVEREWTVLGPGPKRQQPPLPEGIDPGQLAGDYVLTLVATVGHSRDTLVRGRLALRRVRRGTEAGGTAGGPPLWGWVDAPLGRLDDFGLPDLLAGADSARFHLTVLEGPADARTLTFLLDQRPVRPEDGRREGEEEEYTDSGVLLEVFTAGGGRVTGRWASGTALVPVRQGYFCADRIAGAGR